MRGKVGGGEKTGSRKKSLGSKGVIPKVLYGTENGSLKKELKKIMFLRSIRDINWIAM